MCRLTHCRVELGFRLSARCVAFAGAEAYIGHGEDDFVIDQVFLCHNDFITTMNQKPHLEQLLPVTDTSSSKKHRHWDYLYEPGPQELLDAVLQRYIESLVYQGVVENIACEMAARMVAMKSATDNAGELIGELRLIYNKARQAAITQEISEIVAGAAAV